MSKLAAAYKENFVAVEYSDERKLVEAFRACRVGSYGTPLPAHKALSMARARLASRKRMPHVRSIWAKPIGNGAAKDGKRWIEKPESMGLRFVAYPNTIRWTCPEGYYADEYGDETIRGVIYQLPTRGGKCRFVYGHDNEMNGHADNGGPAYLDFSDVYTCDRDDVEDAKRELAFKADAFAQREALRQYEWNKAHDAGFRYAEARAEIAELRARALSDLAIRRNMRNAHKSSLDNPEYQRVCEMVTESVRSTLAEIEKLRGKCKRFVERVYSDELKGAFCDGAGLEKFPA